MVNKIKKYRRDSPSGFCTHLGRGWPPQPPASVAIHGRGEYKIPRKSLSVFLIIILPSPYFRRVVNKPI